MKYYFTDYKDDYSTRKAKDLKDEAIVAKYLDKYFYPEWTISSTRNYDKDLQIAGLDITVIDKSGYKVTIDEKAATQWAGRNLQTFAQEISSLNIYGKEYDGWLLDFHSSSDYLVEVWVDDLSSKDGKLNDYTNITDATIVLIKKSDLWKFLKYKNISSTELRELGEKLRNYNQSHYYLNGYKITHQQRYQEHAVNILIPRETLINTLSTYAVRIKNDEVEVLHKQLS